MENLQYAEELVREFLVFRGFTKTLQVFEKELGTDIGKGFQVDSLLDLIFSVYIPKCQAENLVNLLHFFKQCFGSYEAELMSTLSKLEVSIIRYYIIHALQTGRKEKVTEFFNFHGNALLQKHEDWALWFALPYYKNPHLDPEFRLYFSKEWINTLHLSVRNFLSTMLNSTRIPALLKISSEQNTVNRLKGDIKQLNLKISQLQALLEEKEIQLRQAKSNTSATTRLPTLGMSSSSNVKTGFQEQNVSSSSSFSHDICDPATSNIGERESSRYINDTRPAHSQELMSCMSKSEGSNDFQNVQDTSSEMQGEEEFPEVRVGFQETFLGHTSPITRCRFSASGDNIASASVDGTVRIWTYEPSVSSSRNATIYCGAEIMSLEWDCKSDRLLLIGTADGGIKAWNVDAKRVVCDLNSTKAFPSVLDLKCSPVEPIFVSAAASTRPGSAYFDKLGFASLTVWNMRTWKPMTVLPLGEDPPAITSLCFNHNGKLLAAAATDGMIHMFDMSAGLQITGWPAHDTAISSVLFGSDETSIFTLGADGKIFEWSLQNQGKVLWSRNCSRFCNLQSGSIYKQEMALDANGNRLLTTSNSLRAPIYQVGGSMGGMRTLPHTASITTVDWHPMLPIFLTGSADQSVRVTSLL
ncbi:PREDICTED: WD repeat-containing protein 91 homolog isoform X1 [Ipomoea nil]|uniref:WD repeat-containing protein 91 homolog isoform X1 n=1 Tax=Ipomoea nil TaxID=35883 RepID=UPI0009020090|nr:PREDICTED: WD repeat-containing protein 91 homolog isoform X1 [Ipomoea nil]XP_019178062.1 PREDICTED: WD repeat-containing protein 91 homolog isoform X1 [Ipomoea nil]